MEYTVIACLVVMYPAHEGRWRGLCSAFFRAPLLFDYFQPNQSRGDSSTIDRLLRKDRVELQKNN